VWFLHYYCIYIVPLNWIQYTPNKTLNPKWKKNTKPWDQRSQFMLRTGTIDPGGIALQRVHVETYRSRFVLEPGPALVPSNWSRFGNRDQWPKWTGSIGPFSTSGMWSCASGRPHKIWLVFIFLGSLESSPCWSLFCLCFSSSVTVVVLVGWSHWAFTRRLPDCLPQQILHDSSKGGVMVAACLWLTPLFVVVTS
jgi:hypothetical protein